MKTYFLRHKATGKMIDAFEGRDGKERAEELAAIHNARWPKDAWCVTEESI